MNTKRKTILFFILLALPVIIILRLKSFLWAGGRDAGAFAYIGDMILHGQIPYRDIWDHKTPLIYYLNALLLKLFGGRFRTIAIFEVFWLFTASVFIYKSAKMVFRRSTSLFVGLIFAVYAGTLEIAESFGMTETYSILPAVMAVFSIIKYNITSKRIFIFISGLMSAAAFLFRQTGAAVILPIILYLAINCFYEKRKFSRLILEYLVFIIGVLAPIALFSVYFLVNGALKDCVFQVFTYSFKYSSVISYSFPASIQMLIHETFITTLGRWPFLIGFGVAGVLYKFFDIIEGDFAGELKNKAVKPNAREYGIFFLLFSWFLADLYSVTCSGHYYKHYYVQVIPSLALLSGYSLEYLERQFKSSLRFVILLAVLFLFSSPLFYDAYKALSFAKHRETILDDASAVLIDGVRYRCESPDLVRWIIKNTSKDDYVYFWGGEPGLNFLMKRRIPTRYICLYSFQISDCAEDPDLRRLIADFKENKPKFIIDTSSNNPWIPTLNLQRLRRGESPCRWKRLLPAIEFINDNYVYETSIDGWDIYKRERHGVF